MVKSCSLAFAMVAGMLVAGPAVAQVGKPVTIVDANFATEKELSAMPHMTAALAKSVIDARPFQSAVDLDKLLANSLSADQRKELYGKLFVHLNLNTCTKEEIMLIPNAGARMATLPLARVNLPHPAGGGAVAGGVSRRGGRRGGPGAGPRGC